MRRAVPLVLLCALTVFVTVVPLTHSPAAAAQDVGTRFGRRAMAPRPMPHTWRAARPDAGLGVSEWVKCGVKLTPATAVPLGLPQAVYDGAQGVIVGWSDDGGSNSDCFAARLSGTGDFVTGWTAGGNPVSLSDSSQLLVSAATDNANGAFFLYTDLNVTASAYLNAYLQHLTSAGAPASGFPADGKTLVTGEVSFGVILPDGGGGLFFAWAPTASTVRLKRLDATGATFSPWPPGGLDTGIPDQVDGDAVADGSGGVYATWGSATTVVVQRFVSTGPASGWPVGGVVAGTPGAPVAPRIIRLTSGDVMVAWVNPITNRVFAQRVTSAGAVHASWPAAGLQVSTAAGPQSEQLLVPDNAGGAYVMWHEEAAFSLGRPYLQRLTATGGVFGGWPGDGVPLISTDTEYSPPSLVSDAADGAIAAWMDFRNGTDTDIYIQRVGPTGAVFSGWPVDGRLVCDAAGNQGFPVVTTDGPSGAIVTWLDMADGVNQQIHSARVLNDGTVSALASLVEASAERGLVRLHWHTPDGSVGRAIVERAEQDGEFFALGEILADGAGHLRYEDRAVAAGTTYRYRLAVPDGATIAYLGQVTVRVPVSVSFGIEGFRPNPAAGEVSVAFALESAASASLELLDVAGRRVLAQEVGSLGAGEHVVRLEKSAQLPAGIYVVRLTQAGRTVVSRAAIVR